METFKKASASPRKAIILTLTLLALALAPVLTAGWFLLQNFLKEKSTAPNTKNRPSFVFNAAAANG